jgi:hypothetical protein
MNFGNLQYIYAECPRDFFVIKNPDVLGDFFIVEIKNSIQRGHSPPLMHVLP